MNKDFMGAMLLVWVHIGMVLLACSVARVLGASAWDIRVGSAAWFGWLAATVGSALMTFGPIYGMTLLS